LSKTEQGTVFPCDYFGLA